MKKIIILGAGAIGSVYGALLSHNYDATLVGNKEHVEAIQKNGLKIIGIGNKRYKIKALTKVNKIEPETLVIVTTKAHDLSRALRQIKPLLKKDTLIIYPQNGLGLEEEVKRIVKKNAFRGVSLIGAAFLKPGIVDYNGKATLILPNNGKLRDFLKKSKLKIKFVNNINEYAWKKAMVNCVLNPLTALYRVNNGGLLRHKKKVRALLNECLSIAKKAGFAPGKNMESMESDFFKILRLTKNNKSSMLQDIIKGKKTEIGYLNGYMLKLAKKYNMKAPYNKEIVLKIKALENKAGKRASG